MFFLPIALTARLWLLAIIIIAMVGYQLGRQLDKTPVAGCPWGGAIFVVPVVS